MTRFLKFTCLIALAALAGCGSEPQQQGQPQAALERGIFISANDCADSGKLTLEQCAGAIDMAVALHGQQAPSYKTLARCVAAEGEGRCDNTVDGYRARLQAFLVTMGPQPSAIPLYPSAPGKSGFRSAKKDPFDTTDDSFSISVAALSVANDNAKTN